MTYDLYIAGLPGRVGGACTELLHNAHLFREMGVRFCCVHFHDPDPDGVSICEELRWPWERYKRGMFAGQRVVGWNNGSLLCHLPEIYEDGAPSAVIYGNCMTVLHPIEIKCHARGWITHFMYVSNFQRSMIKRPLERMRPVNELEGYTPFLKLEDPIQGLHRWKYWRQDTFSIGRISRDDAAKFSPDTWEIFDRVCVPSYMRKQIDILGFGPNAERMIGRPVDESAYNLMPPGSIPVRQFYEPLHAVAHWTGGSRESFCRIVLECWATGTVILAENAYAFPELIDDGVDGILCDTPLAMSVSMSQLTYEPLRRRIVDAGMEKLKGRFANPAVCWRAWQSIFPS